MRVLFYPETPWRYCPSYTALRVVEYMEWDATVSPDDEVGLAFMWEDETWVHRSEVMEKSRLILPCSAPTPWAYENASAI